MEEEDDLTGLRHHPTLIHVSGQIYEYSVELSRYVTEGMLRASHRKEYGTPPPGHPRKHATRPGEPFHSFTQPDAQEVPQGTAVLCRFQMIPTAYTFAEASLPPAAFGFLHSIRQAT